MPELGAKIRRVVCSGVTKPLPLYSHATVYDGVVYVSGVQGFIPQTFDFPQGELIAQARQVFRNMNTILQDAGSALSSVLKLSVFLIDIQDLEVVSEALKEAFPDGIPALSVVSVKALPRSCKVVADAVAAVK